MFIFEIETVFAINLYEYIIWTSIFDKKIQANSFRVLENLVSTGESLQDRLFKSSSRIKI